MSTDTLMTHSHCLSCDVNILQLCDSLTADDVSKGFKTTKQADKNAKKLESDMGTVHTLLNEEQAAFADWINDTFIGKDVIFISTFSEYY